MTADLESWTAIATVYDPLKVGSIDGTDTYPHDKGIVRALKAKYEPNKHVKGDPLCTIFVGRLDLDTTDDTLREMFGEFGSIRHCRLVRDIITGFSKRYAFIEYKSSSAAQLAAQEGHRMRIDGVRVLVDMELERELKGWVPRRLGGGFGGRKESGQLRFGGKDRPWRKPIKLAEPHGRYERTGQRVNNSNGYHRRDQPNRRQPSSYQRNERTDYRRDSRDGRRQETSGSRNRDRTRRSRSRESKPRRNRRRSRSPVDDYYSSRGKYRSVSRDRSNSYSRRESVKARHDSRSSTERETRKRYYSESSDAEQKSKKKKQSRSRSPERPHKRKESVVEEQAFGRWVQSGSEDGEVHSDVGEPEKGKKKKHKIKKSRFHNYDSDCFSEGN